MQQDQPPIDSLRSVLGAAGLDPATAEPIFDGRDAASLPAARSLALLAFDADAVQASVLASPRPVTIAGASAALRSWDEGLPAVVRDVAGAWALFSGGGTATVVVPSGGGEPAAQRARRLGEHLEREYARTVYGTAATAFLEVSPRELVAGPSGPAAGAPHPLLDRLGFRLGPGRGFGRCLAQLQLRLRARKDEGRPHPWLDGEHAGPRCSECGVRPRDSRPLPPRDWPCQACRAHHEGGRDRKRDLDEARSFDDLFKGGHGLAFLSLDGADIGGHLRDLRSVGEYCRFSRKLHEAFDVLYVESDRERLGLKEQCFLCVLSGGDDLLLVVPAMAGKGQPDAFTLAAGLLEHVESAFGGPDDRQVGAGCGIVVTGGLQASFAFDYARQLCKSAKRVIERGDPGARSAVDFAVVLGGSPLAEDPPSLRDDQAIRPKGGLPGIPGATAIRQTQAPYTLGRFRTMLAASAVFRGLPRSQVMSLRNGLAREPETALLSTWYQLARHEELRDAFGVDSLAGAPGPPASLFLAPVPGEEGTWATALPDLAEAARIVGPETRRP